MSGVIGRVFFSEGGGSTGGVGEEFERRVGMDKGVSDRNVDIITGGGEEVRRPRRL